MYSINFCLMYRTVVFQATLGKIDGFEVTRMSLYFLRVPLRFLVQLEMIYISNKS